MLQGGFLKNKNKGFTLIELLVVISIIGLLSTVVLASLQNVRRDAKWRKFESELIQIRTAVQLYRENNNGNWPNAMIGNNDLNSLVLELKNAGVYSSAIIVPPDSDMSAALNTSYKLSPYSEPDTEKYSCGNGGYQDVYAILYFNKNDSSIPIPYTKTPRLYSEGLMIPDNFYCIDFR